MIPMTVTFSSGETIILYSEDPDAFTQSVLEAKPPEIMEITHHPTQENEVQVDLQEVKLTLQSGAIILCNIEKKHMPKAAFIREIADCDTSNVIAYGKLAKIEAELDTRFAATSAVINNLPDLDVRLHLHQAYLKRKAAYVAVIEALVDGIIRRPNE